MTEQILLHKGDRVRLVRPVHQVDIDTGKIYGLLVAKGTTGTIYSNKPMGEVYLVQWDYSEDPDGDNLWYADGDKLELID